mgnify:CR=1 FL=1
MDVNAITVDAHMQVFVKTVELWHLEASKTAWTIQYIETRQSVQYLLISLALYISGVPM